MSGNPLVVRHKTKWSAAQMRQVLAELRRIRERNAARWGVYPGDPVGEAREERMRQMEEACRQWS